MGTIESLKKKNLLTVTIEDPENGDRVYICRKMSAISAMQCTEKIAAGFDAIEAEGSHAPTADGMSADEIVALFTRTLELHMVKPLFGIETLPAAGAVCLEDLGDDATVLVQKIFESGGLDFTAGFTSFSEVTKDATSLASSTPSDSDTTSPLTSS